MKKRFTEEQIIGFLREADAGLSVKELCRKHGFSEPSYYAWKAKFGGHFRNPSRAMGCSGFKATCWSAKRKRMAAALGTLAAVHFQRLISDADLF